MIAVLRYYFILENDDKVGEIETGFSKECFEVVNNE